MSSEKEMVRFVFRLDKCDHRPSICLDALSLQEICSRFDISLSPDRQPLGACELFTESFESEVFPFIGKLLRNRFTKTKFAKLWEAQPVTVRKIYERRADILLAEWKRMRAERDAAAVDAVVNEADVEAARLLAMDKAKRKEESQRRADIIAQQIASGAFDEPEPEPVSVEAVDAEPIPEVRAKPSKKKKVKKKKPKKWKNKKVRQSAELWPVQTANGTSEAGSVSGSVPKSPERARARPQSTWPISNNLKSAVSALDSLKVSSKKLVDSELRFRLQIERVREGDAESASQSEWLEEWMDAAEMECVRRKVCGAEFVAVRVRVWLYLDVDLCGLFGAHSIELRTDRDRVAMQSHGDAQSGDAPVMLFELSWAAFGDQFKQRVDADHIRTAFVKNTRSLRLDIPLLELPPLSPPRCDI